MRGIVQAERLAGDGNFHLTVLIDMDDPAEVRAAEQLSARQSASLEIGTQTSVANALPPGRNAITAQ